MYSEGTESPHNATVGTVHRSIINTITKMKKEKKHSVTNNILFSHSAPWWSSGFRLLSHLTRLPPSPPQHLISSTCFIFKWSDSIGSPPLKSCPSALLNVMCSNTSIDKNSFVTFRNQHPIDWCPLTSNYDEALPLTTVPLTHKNRKTPVIPRL